MKDHDHQCDLAKFGLTELDPNEDGSWLNEAGIAMFQACADFLNGLLAGRAWVCLPEHIASWIVALVANKYATASTPATILQSGPRTYCGCLNGSTWSPKEKRHAIEVRCIDGRGDHR